MAERRIRYGFPEEEEDDDDELLDDETNEDPSAAEDASRNRVLFMSDGGEAVLLRELARVKQQVYDNDSKKSTSMEENSYDNFLEWEEDRIITQLLLYTPLFCGDENEVIIQMIRKNKAKVLIGFLMQRGKYEMALEVRYNKWGVFRVFSFFFFLVYKCIFFFFRKFFHSYLNRNALYSLQVYLG
jgi:hypothetical protein